jgi:hypothetical protein
MNLIASGATRRLLIENYPSLKGTNFIMHQQFVPFRDRNLVEYYVGLHPTLLNSSLSAITLTDIFFFNGFKSSKTT